MWSTASEGAMFEMIRFISEARIKAGQRPLGTANDSPRHQITGASTISAMLSTPVRKVATGSSCSAMWNSGQLVPQRSVSSTSRASTFKETLCTDRLRLVLVRRLEEAAVDAPAAVGQLRHRVEGGERPAVGPDDMDLLRRLAVQLDDLAVVEDLRAVDRLIALPHHVHEDVGAAEQALDAGRGEAEGGVAIVAPEGIDLAADDVADCRAVLLRHGSLLRHGGPSEGDSQEEGKEAGRHGASLTPACSVGERKLARNSGASPALRRSGNFIRLRAFVGPSRGGDLRARSSTG